MPEITTINLGGVNCYLLKEGDNTILVDTGYTNKCSTLEKRLSQSGCLPGKLKLIVLTHGDEDHTGNCLSLRKKYGVKIAMHADDTGMVERGDANWNRKARPDRFSLVFKIMSVITPLFVKAGTFEKFKPDLTVDESFNLSEYGLDAKIVQLPGHSKGSIGVLTGNGALFCGDFLYNMPGFSFIDDLSDHKLSVEKVRKMNVKIIYPGHGGPISGKKLKRKLG